METGIRNDGTRRLRVWHLMGPLRPSGMERMLVSAAPYWATQGVDGTVLGQGDEHPFVSQLEKAGYNVRVIPPMRTRHGAAALLGLLRREQPDVLHIHTEGAFALAVLAARSARVPAIRTVHNCFPARGPHSWSRRLQSKLVDRLVSDFVAPSPDVAVSEARIGRRCRVLFNWVADEFLQHHTNDRNQDSGWAIIVGNASPIKNHLLALRAVRSTQMPLAYVGSEANASTDERSLLDRLAADGLLRYRGPGDPMRWFSGADVFLMPSRHEGMGIALAEALQLGIPAIVSDVEGFQWAKGLDGVTMLPLDEQAWEMAIPTAVLAGRDRTRSHPDFAARRGASDYLELYRRARSARNVEC